jgi:hypothetical protein
MIKQKGVCDVCTKEFELNGGSFGVKIDADNLDYYSHNFTFTVLLSAKAAPSDSPFLHVCGKACLYRLFDQHIDKAQEPKECTKE